MSKNLAIQNGSLFKKMKFIHRFAYQNIEKCCNNSTRKLIELVSFVCPNESYMSFILYIHTKTMCKT